MWHKESSLNSTSHVYFLKNVDGVLHAGTDRGVFVLGGDGTWSADLTFPQATFDVQWNPERMLRVTQFHVDEITPHYLQ